MESSRRYLTVHQFADEMGVSKQIVNKWIRKGILEGVLRYKKGPYLIPDNNLSMERLKRGRPLVYKVDTNGPTPEKRKRGRPKSHSGPVSNPEEAKEKYNSRSKYKIPFSYDELKDLFDKGMTQQDIARLAGVSRERIRQIHAAYFAPFDISGRERYKIITKGRQKVKAIAHAEGVEKLWALIAAGEELGLIVEPIVTEYNSSRCYPNLARVNGRLCGVHYAKKISHQSTHRYYFHVNIAKNLIENAEFTIIFTGEDARPAFILPSKIILNLDWRDRYYKSLYIPEKKLPAYNNQYPKIDWWKYKEAWHQLEDN